VCPPAIPFIVVYFIVRNKYEMKENNTILVNNKNYIKNNLPYEKKTSQITDAEMNFYKVLDEVNAVIDESLRTVGKSIVTVENNGSINCQNDNV
jgi:hypothetical protein